MKYYQKCINLLVTTFRILQLLGTSFPRSPNGASHLDTAGELPIPRPPVVSPHPKPPSAAFDIQDLITRASFGDDRLRVLGLARGRISYFPIDLRRRSYNTLALPCECVMCGCVCGLWVFVTLRAKLCYAVYSNRFRLFVSVFVGLFVVCYHDNSKLCASIFTKLGL